MKAITWVNPSKKLLQAVEQALQTVEEFKVIDISQVRTCEIKGCMCSDHDRGYHRLEVEAPDGFEIEVHVHPAYNGRHERTLTKVEHAEIRTLKGIPLGAPDWADAKETARVTPEGLFRGHKVTVEQEGEFTVVRLLEGANEATRNPSSWWKMIRPYATKDGVTNDTQLWKNWRFEKKREEELRRFEDRGLKTVQAERLFRLDYRKERWEAEGVECILTNAARLGESRQILRSLAKAKSAADQSEPLNALGLSCGVQVDMDCPSLQTFAKKALWVFFQIKSRGLKLKKPYKTKKPKPE